MKSFSYSFERLLFCILLLLTKKRLIADLQQTVALAIVFKSENHFHTIY